MTSETSDEPTNQSGADEPREMGAVLLAAGESTRFEHGNKLLATVEETPIVRHATRTLVESQIDDIVVVVGHEADAVRDALSSLDVEFTHNDRYAEGQSTSVRVGVDTARENGWDATLFALGDMPFVKPSTVDAVLSAYLAQRGTIVAPAHEGKRGNPALFDAVHYDALAAVTGDKGGRRLIEQHEDSVLVETDDPGVTRDVDYEVDLEKYTG